MDKNNITTNADADPTGQIAFDWSELAFASKKPLRSLKAIFIAAPREISEKRFLELVKTYLPKANILLGIAKEAYVDGLENQPQFRMLTMRSLQKIIDSVSRSSSKHKIYTLEYFQRETNYIVEKVGFSKVVCINGSWHHSFHLQPLYYTLANNKIDYELISSFCDELEAKTYEKHIESLLATASPSQVGTTGISEPQALRFAEQVAKRSYDHTNQTGVVLGKAQAKGYAILAEAYNKVVPYQTYAMLNGALRERHFSPPNDLNYYDTIHAEVALLIDAQRRGLDLHGATVFINVLPCPTCGRMLAETDIAEVVYRMDHSDGYAFDILQRAGKKVRRVAL